MKYSIPLASHFVYNWSSGFLAHKFSVVPFGSFISSFSFVQPFAVLPLCSWPLGLSAFGLFAFSAVSLETALWDQGALLSGTGCSM